MKSTLVLTSRPVLCCILSRSIIVILEAGITEDVVVHAAFIDLSLACKIKKRRKKTTSRFELHPA